MHRGNRYVGAVVGALVLLACGGRTDVEEGPEVFDASPDVLTPPPRDAAAIDAMQCPPGDHACNGTCVRETTESCGPSCSPCPRHAHVASRACTDGACVYECEPGYHLCDAGCCGAQVTAISAGKYHTCALDTDGAVLCWGANDTRQLGDDTSFDRASPVRVTSIPKVWAIAAGGGHTSALAVNGGIWSWGANDYGQLGRLSNPERPGPTDDPSAGATLLAAGECSTCAVIAGVTSCWGCVDVPENPWGSTSSLTPVSGIGAGEATSLGVGTRYACAGGAGGSAKCWGRNPSGQLGNGTLDDSPAAQTVIGLTSGVWTVSASDAHACAVRLDGSLWCWGQSPNGELGLTSPDPILRATRVPNLPSPVREAAVRPDGVCIRLESRDVYCWSRNEAPRRIDLPSGAIQVVAGYVHACALLESGRVACWGANGLGTLGDGIFGVQEGVVLVDGL